MAKQTRRIVTGHDTDGTAIFLHDDILTSVNPFKADGSPPSEGITGFTTIAKTVGFPDTSVNSPFVDLHGRKIDLADQSGVTCRIVDFPPSAAVTAAAAAAAAYTGAAHVHTLEGFNPMHRTISTDFGVVLEGTISLKLDSGQIKQMTVGDVVVQRGTIHEWKNESLQNCRILFVLVPSQPVKVESTGELLPGSDTTNFKE